jgi:hypothetical protein
MLRFHGKRASLLNSWFYRIIKRLQQKGVALGSELEGALSPPKEEALGRALGPAGGEGLNRSKLISRQEKIQVPTAELQTTELASIPAFVRSHNIQMYQNRGLFWHTVMLACAMPWLENDSRTWQERWLTRKATQLMHFSTWIPKRYTSQRNEFRTVYYDNSVTMHSSVSLEMSKSIISAITIKKPPQVFHRNAWILPAIFACTKCETNVC